MEISTKIINEHYKILMFFYVIMPKKTCSDNNNTYMSRLFHKCPKFFESGSV